MARGTANIDYEVYRTPSAEEVAALVELKGMEGAVERWWYVGERTLGSMAQAARARKGVLSVVRRARSYSELDGAVAVEVAFVLGSMSRGERAGGLRKVCGRSLCTARGLTPPSISDHERGEAGAIGRAALARDRVAIGIRQGRLDMERAVGGVLRIALALVPEQPATGRYRLPPPDDALREALREELPAAVELVFPGLGLPAPVPTAPDQFVPQETAVARLSPNRKLPPDASIIRLHAEGITISELAEHAEVSEQAVYGAWRRLGLPTKGRWTTKGGPSSAPVPKRAVPAQAPAQVEPQSATLPAVVPVEPVEPVPAVAEAAPAGLLSFDSLALAVALAKITHVSPQKAIAFVHANEQAATNAVVQAAFDEVMGEHVDLHFGRHQ